MRIYNSNRDEVINEVDICLTIDEAKDFYHRIYDLTNNLVYKNDVIFEDFKENIEERYKVISAIFIAVYTDENIDSFPDRIKKVILEDK